MAAVRKPVKRAGMNRRAVDATVKALRAAGRVEPVDTAVLVAAERLADAVDLFPERATLWKEYREALVMLAGVGKDAEPDGLDDLLEQIADRAKMGNPPPA